MKVSLSLLAVLAISAVIIADTVTLKDGRKYEGVIVEETELQVKIKTAKALLTFKREEVASIEKGESPVQERETRLTACTPDNPKTYVDAAEWLGGPGKAMVDTKTMVRICNIASFLDDKLAARAQVILGKYHQSKGDKDAAGWAYARALLAEPTHAEAQAAVDGVRKDMLDKAVKQLKELQAALSLFLDDKTKEAIPALRKCERHHFADRAREYMQMTVVELADGLQKLIPCAECKGVMRIKCTPCDGTGKIRCEDCKGTGKKPNPKPTFAGEVCRYCWHAGSLLCQSCAAERTVTIHFAQEFEGTKSVAVKLEGGVEDVGIKPVINIQNWTRRKGGSKVTAMIYGGVTKGGLRTCTECNGVPYEPATEMPGKAPVATYRDEVAKRVSGATPIDALVGDGKVYDEAAVADKAFRYEEGDWVK